ncbi:endogenous retrovirus group K member 6 Pro protein-like [Cavia porcellus]|uniref:endogenous retrovirus group K member 6 Pro protein-like n=1 Tax=Cavia porcellus TaxID=10141 RepID=UPI000661A2E0|nr:endogenous retrovirus group K member 6 Pro protein-like [Cavia porcellus]
MQAPKGPVALGVGDCIAQMLVLPSRHGDYPSLSGTRGDRGFGSSDSAFVALFLRLDEHPMLTMSLNGRKISGLLDTGADRSIIAEKDWPLTWPTQTAQQTLQGLGSIHAPKISSQIIKLEDNEGHSGEFIPYVLQLPVTLWGREVLSALDLTLCNEYSHTARRILKNQGYEPGKGLGKDLQGRPFPIQAQPRVQRQGLGF